MADTTLAQTILVAAVTSVATLAGKYVVDRFTESHKATVALRVKRQERFYSKQAEVIAEGYAKLEEAVCLAGAMGSVLATGENTEERNKDHFRRVLKAFWEVNQYFSVNSLYFSKDVNAKIGDLTGSILVAAPRPNQSEEAATKALLNTGRLLSTLRDDFYKLIAVE